MNIRRLKDLAERVLLTFVGAFIAVYLAAFAANGSDLSFFTDSDLLNKAGVAGIAAVVPFVAGLIGFKTGDRGTASVVPSNKPEEVSPFLYQYIDTPDDRD